LQDGRTAAVVLKRNRRGGDAFSLGRDQRRARESGGRDKKGKESSAKMGNPTFKIQKHMPEKHGGMKCAPDPTPSP